MAKTFLGKSRLTELSSTPVDLSLPLDINNADVASINQLVQDRLSMDITQSIENIHALTSKTIIDTHKSAVESISSIGVAHESKASEAIQAIERMNKSALSVVAEESVHNRMAIAGAFALSIGLAATGAALYMKNK